MTTENKRPYYPRPNARGQKRSDEARAKMSAAQKGKPKSEEHKKKMSLAATNKPKSEEHRLAISAGISNWWNTRYNQN